MMADIKKHLPFQFVVDEQILHKKKETRPILLRGRSCLIDEHIYAVYIITELSTRIPFSSSVLR
jgi:hypothetical protein